ncbi:divergent protein kinase domain 1C-like isoform X1 [Acipenser ruthenus]|uniref:divergent protein kinase domain 1C-like isoform X1 n=1 Tax=Acipenser ruthenus TaxID=7906 RepID=UPI0027410366|nr:divergent protein kinase domain 1C-like isoform X1 [Acipenser ruthenus]
MITWRSCVFRRLGVKIFRKNTLLFALFWFGFWIFMSALMFVHRTIFSDHCTDEKSKRILARVCDGYKEGILTGDLCEDLCISKQVVYQRCLYYEKGKKVIQADWAGIPIILKSKLENFSSYDNFGMLDYQEMQDVSTMDIVFYAALEIKNLLGLELINTTVPKLWTKHLQGRVEPYSKAELATMWSLLQQEEYTFFKILQDLSKHVVKVLGSCGHFYAVEYLIAGHAWNQNLFSLEELFGSSVTGHNNKALRGAIHTIALSFLDMVKHFENDFSYHLHLCDIKPENFAIRKDLTVVAIDVDMAFFEPKMRDILQQNCTNDEDCNFFDCFSKCDMQHNRCGAKRINSNLQVICDKMFRHWFSPSLIGSRASLPLQVELQKAVQRCAVPTEEYPKNKKDHRTLFSQLYGLLQASQRQLQE